MSFLGLGRKREPEQEPDYQAIIEAAEERARFSVEAWAAEQSFEYDEETDDEETTDDEESSVESAPVTTLLSYLFGRK